MECIKCKLTFPPDQLLLLAEWELGLSPKENYIYCNNCYEEIENESS